jgi:hypothetical protein
MGLLVEGIHTGDVLVVLRSLIRLGEGTTAEVGEAAVVDSVAVDETVVVEDEAEEEAFWIERIMKAKAYW